MMKKPPTATAVRAGRIVSGLVVAVLLADAAVNLFAPHLLAREMAASGFPVELAPVVGTLLVLCAVTYAFPRTAPMGAILIAGFFGGAICVHLRMGEIGSPPQIISLLIGVLAWAGLVLRDPTVRALFLPAAGPGSRQLPAEAMRSAS